MKVNDTLAYSGDTWTGEPTSFVRRWQRTQADIPGATGATYTATADDAGKMIRVGLKGINAAGESTEVFSAEVGPIEAAAAESAPTISATNEVSSLWLGAVSTNSITATATTNDLVQPVRIVVGTDAAFANALYSSQITPTDTAAAKPFARGTVTGLAADTAYHIGVEVNGVIDSTRTGTFRTWPAGNHSYSYAAASCSTSSTYLAGTQTASNGRIFDHIRARAEAGTISEFMHMGDMHYGDINVDDVSQFYKMWDLVFGQVRQRALWATIPMEYQRDDHDGPTNNGDAKSTAAAASNEAYRTFVPHRALASATLRDPVYYSRVRGRVRRIVTDIRTARSPIGNTDDVNKVVLGAVQEQWFKDECLAAKSAGQLIEWVNTKPWLSSSDIDTWWSFSTERQRLVTFITDNALQGRMWMISGDMHASAYCAAADNPYGGFPVFHAAPIDRSASNKGGPYTLGPFPSGTTASTSIVGIFDVADNGTDGANVRFRAFQTDQSSGLENATPLIDVTVARSTSGVITPPATNFGNVVRAQSANVQPARTSISITASSAPVTGNLLVLSGGPDKAITGLTGPAGWTPLWANSGAGNSAYGWYRIADGTETAPLTVTWNEANLSALVLIEIEGPFAGLDVPVAFVTSGSIVASLTAGPTSAPTLGNVYGIGIYQADSAGTMGTPTYGNGFTEIINVAGSAAMSLNPGGPGLFAAGKLITDGTAQSLTVSHTGTADQASLGLALFKASAVSDTTPPAPPTGLSAIIIPDPLSWAVEPGSEGEAVLTLGFEGDAAEYQVDDGTWLAMPGVKIEDAIESLTDPFAGTSLDATKWTTQGTVTVSGGAARIAATEAFDGRLVHRRIDWVLADSSITWRMGATNYRNSMAGRGVFDVAGRWETRQIRWGHDSGNLVADIKLGVDVVTPVGGGGAYDPAVHVYFRLREDAGTLYYDWSTDGAAWTNYGSVTPPYNMLSGITVYFFASDWAGTVGTIDISEINA